MRKSKIKEPLYVVMNDIDEVFIGLLGGNFVFSPKWEEAKPLCLPNTKLLTLSGKCTLIEENEFFN
jgi:uncharacterized protein YlzI (FlbEa/FlbD family)